MKIKIMFFFLKTNIKTAGKKVCKRYGAQSLVMDKMNHHDRQVEEKLLREQMIRSAAIL